MWECRFRALDMKAGITGVKNGPSMYFEVEESAYGKKQEKCDFAGQKSKANFEMQERKILDVLNWKI